MAENEMIIWIVFGGLLILLVIETHIQEGKITQLQKDVDGLAEALMVLMEKEEA